MNMSIPRCFNSRRQYDLWKDVARRISPGGSGYCADCSAEYQAQMLAHLRCAYPATTFHVDGDGFVEGRRPAKERVRCREVA